MTKRDDFERVSLDELSIGDSGFIEAVSDGVLDDGTLIPGASEELSNDVSTLQDDVNELEDTVNTLLGSTDEHDEDLGTLQEQIDALQDDLNNLEGTVDNLEGDVSDLEDRGEIYVVDDEADAPSDRDESDLVAIRE